MNDRSATAKSATLWQFAILYNVHEFAVTFKESLLNSKEFLIQRAEFRIITKL